MHTVLVMIALYRSPRDALIAQKYDFAVIPAERAEGGVGQTSEEEDGQKGTVRGVPICWHAPEAFGRESPE